MTEPTDPMAEIKASFFIECEELLEAMHDGLQTIDDGEWDAETINVVFRAVHSIKGGAGAFGLEKLVRFAHRYETVMDSIRSGTLEIDSSLLKLFFRCADHLSDLVRAARDGFDLPDDQGKLLTDELDVAIGGSPEEEAEEEEIDFQPMGLNLDLDLDLDLDIPDMSVEPEQPKFYIHFTPNAELFETGNEPFQILKALQELGKCKTECNLDKLPALEELSPEMPYLSWQVTLSANVETAEIESVFEFVDGLCDLKITSDSAQSPNVTPEVDDLPDLPEPPPTQDDAPDTGLGMKPPQPLQTPPKAPGAAAAKSVVRVDLDRIERLVNLVGELVINQAMLSQSLEAAGLSPHSDAMNGLEEFQRLTRDIQDSVMMIRAQPVKSLFQRMSRIIREASAAVNKDVRLETDGENTEVDKTVIERLADPLTHMIRNAVDHGLETTADRKAAGKSPQGQVRLTAAHRSGRVVIEVSDDGGGINRPKVQQIATEKGLIPADAVLLDTEIDNLLFLPGFSTASSVSDLSGRGVGMDVVRTSIQALGGRITITSQKGVGTTFSISLPLTLAVLDGMVVQIAEETLVLPLNVVVETLTLTEENLDQVRPGLDVVRVRGEFVPLFDLGVSLGYRETKDSYIDSVVLLIVQEDGNRAALIVDDIQDQRQVVIKGLDDSFYRAPGIAAATILGDGQIALILDPSDIIVQAQDSSAATRFAS
ncbi:Chemotaxis protein CheA [Ascidiaceihabitans donghaensis]|uniref:Chemotaxis protein CheA n=1 Tax=Ascidiaceihabitans donghaensis TaxID=1510460 RepID=A0A2R8BEW8_9RHOB|nr:chemotaxis protein CheA [Ascidiaceihabitans donghaensis]SPH21555.1 Chemotaxis protein CheA [Ascidiaceihabitans donghaensis]